LRRPLEHGELALYSANFVLKGMTLVYEGRICCGFVVDFTTTSGHLLPTSALHRVFPVCDTGRGRWPGLAENADGL